MALEPGGNRGFFAIRDYEGFPLVSLRNLKGVERKSLIMRGEFYVPVPAYVADAIEVWESVRPPNQGTLLDRKTHKPTQYLFQYRNDLMGEKFLNGSVIPLLCKLAGVSQTDVVGRITSHRARATTATWMHKMGMAPADIGTLLGHTDPLRSLPWYLREDKHRLGRAYRKANPLERYVAAILDTNAHARQEPCVFYYLSDGPDGARECAATHTSRAASINCSVLNVKPSLTTSRPRPLKSEREPWSSQCRSRFHLRWSLS